VEKFTSLLQETQESALFVLTQNDGRLLFSCRALAPMPVPVLVLALVRVQVPVRVRDLVRQSAQVRVTAMARVTARATPDLVRPMGPDTEALQSNRNS
jgi:hypothetical protein